MRNILIIPFLVLTGCLTTTSERLATFIGQDSHYLMKEMGAPTNKETDSNGNVWIYERLDIDRFPSKTVEKVTKRDKDGRPSETVSETEPAYVRKRIYYKYFFFDKNGYIYDTKYTWKTIE